MNKVNLERRADKNFPSGKAWKLWKEMKDEYNPDNSIAETELELAMSKLKSTKKKNPRKIIEEIASCEVKFGIPVSNSKKIAQLICLGGSEYGTIISVTQMCKRTESKVCTSKNLVDKMWKQWQIKGRKEEGEVNSQEDQEASLVKSEDKRKKGNVKKKKETRTCNHCQKKGHIEKDCWEKHPDKVPEKFKKKKDAKTEKAGAAVKEDEHLLSLIDVEIMDNREYEFHNDAAETLVNIKLGLEEDGKDESKSDGSEMQPTLQALNSPNIWIGDTGATKHSTKYKQGGINARPLSSRTRGIYGQAVKPAMDVDIPGVYCNKTGKELFAVKLLCIDVIPENHYSLMSLT